MSGWYKDLRLEMAASLDGSLLYVVNGADLDVVRITPDSQELLNPKVAALASPLLGGSFNTYTAVAISLTGEQLYVAGSWNDFQNEQWVRYWFVQVCDAASLQQIGGTTGTDVAYLYPIALWPHNSRIFVGSSDNSVTVYDVTLDAIPPLQQFGAPVTFHDAVGVRVSFDGSHLYIMDGYQLKPCLPTKTRTIPSSATTQESRWERSTHT